MRAAAVLLEEYGTLIVGVRRSTIRHSADWYKKSRMNTSVCRHTRMYGVRRV